MKHRIRGMALMTGLTLVLIPAFALPLAHIASAHEVYVLDSNEIEFDLKAPPPDFLSTIHDHLGQFIFWGILVAALILVCFFVSINQHVERFLDPILMKLKPYAPHVAQATLGLAMLASGYYGAVFGVELPLGVVFGSYAHIMSWVLMVAGAMLTIGVLPRVAAFCVIAVFTALTFKYHVYMLNYGTYLGEATVIALLGGAHTMFASSKASAFFTRVMPARFHEYSFLFMRVLFGISLIYASLYAKLFHGALALDVVARYHLTQYFPFDPSFLVLGAMIIEVLLGLAFIIGFEIRFASIFFLIFLTLSISFFGEAVWPHIILIGTALAMLMHGYDRETLTVRLERDKTLEPTL